MPRQDSQPYNGPGQADTWLARNLARAGQISPFERNTIMRQHGRQLSGFGALGADGETDAIPDGSPDTASEVVLAAEEADDNFGSGIFDQTDDRWTSNSNMGSFASDYALPGYLARENPYAVSQDEVDATSDAPVITIPAGGLPYVERYGTTVPFMSRGPVQRPGGMRAPAAGTPKTSIYANFQNPTPRPTYNPGPAVPSDMAYGRTGVRSTTYAPIERAPTVYGRPVRPTTVGVRVPSVSRSTPRDPTRGVQGFGGLAEVPIATFVVVGALAGATVFIVRQLVK